MWIGTLGCFGGETIFGPLRLVLVMRLTIQDWGQGDGGLPCASTQECSCSSMMKVLLPEIEYNGYNIQRPGRWAYWNSQCPCLKFGWRKVCFVGGSPRWSVTKLMKTAAHLHMLCGPNFHNIRFHLSNPRWLLWKPPLLGVCGLQLRRGVLNGQG